MYKSYIKTLYIKLVQILKKYAIKFFYWIKILVENLKVMYYKDYNMKYENNKNVITWLSGSALRGASSY